MILAEKIMSLRKRLGWSQEELANRLGVSRQSVSKWESAAAVPDVGKITQMSDLFGVSTDYLLKDDMPDDVLAVLPPPEEPADGALAVPPARPVTLDDVGEYLDTVWSCSKRVALGVMLCIWSPIVLLLLLGLTALGAGVQPDGAVVIGLAALLVLVAAAVFLFILAGARTNKYEYLETEPISLQYGAESAILRRRESYAAGGHLMIAVGVVLIILGVIPAIVLGALWPDDRATVGVAALLLLVGAGVFLIVLSAVRGDAFKKLLQEEDYTPENKAAGKRLAWFPGAYWSAVTALFLAISFLTDRWDRSWIVWPVAAVLFAAVWSVLRAAAQRRQ